MTLRAVTGFWEPATLKREAVRSGAIYLRLFEELHRTVPLPMTIFIDPAWTTPLENVLTRIPVKHDRRVVPRRFDDLPHARHLSDPNFHALLPPDNRSESGKDTHAFAAMTWAKASLVADAAALDLDAESFAWLDFGLAHVAMIQPVDWRAIERACPDRPRVCEMRATHLSELADDAEFYRFIRGKIASGMMTVGRPYVDELRDAVDDEVERAIASGRLTLEENIYGALTARRPELFTSWFSDYHGVVRNYVDVVDDVDCVLDNLTYCRDRSLHEHAVTIYHAVHRSLRRGLIRLDAVDFHRLLHDGFVAAFYVDRSLAENIARRMTALARFSPALRDRLDNALVRANLAHVGVDLDQPELDWTAFAALDDFTAWRSCL